jgi:FtsZ-interacting cell division protein ZipA
MQEMARWEWKLSKARLKREQVAREREAERARKETADRAAERRMWSDEALDTAEMETEATAVETATTQDAKKTSAEVNQETDKESSKASRQTTATPATPSDTMPTPEIQPMQSGKIQLQVPALENTFRRADSGPLLPVGASSTSKPLKKKFKMGKGDTLEMSKSISFMTEVDNFPEPHGFRLQNPAKRPTTAIQV